MSLVKPVPSAATRRACEEGLAEFAAMGRLPSPLGNVYYPQRVYKLAAHELVEGKGLHAAQPVLWQFLLGDHDGTVVAADIAQPRRGEQPHMTSFSQGHLAASSLRATMVIEKLPQVRRRSYELRRFSIPEISVCAFWLKARDGRGDLAVPHYVQTRVFKSMRVYPMLEFLEIARGLAEKRLQFDDSPRSSR